MPNNLPERYEPQQALDFLERASGQLALILDPVDAARFVRQAEMIEYLTRKVKAAEGVQRQAAEIVVRSNRRLGELLAQTERATGSRGSFKKSNDGRSEARPPARPALSDLGIPKQKAAEAQKLAAIPEAEFEHHVTTAPRPTVHGVIAAAEPSSRRAVEALRAFRCGPRSWRVTDCGPSPLQDLSPSWG